MSSRPRRNGRPRSSEPVTGAASPAAPAAVVPEGAAPAWTPGMTVILAVVTAFFLGLFAGQELLHRPQVVAAPPSMSADNPHGDMAASGPADTSSNPSGPSQPGHDDATLRRDIEQERNPDRLVGLARILAEENRPDLATQAYQRVLDLGSRRPDVYRDLAMMEWTLGKPDDAESHLHLALKLDPRDAASHFALGVVLEKNRHDLAGARKEMQQALALHPSKDTQALIESEINRLGTG